MKFHKKVRRARLSRLTNRLKSCIMQIMEKYTHKRTFDVGFCDVDFKDEIKASALLAFFEEAACSSADELGFGYSYLKERGYAFMITELRASLKKPIRLNDRLTVETWPTPPKHVVFGREFVLSVNGEKIGTATSKWCMVDFENGKILGSKLLVEQDYSTYNPDVAYLGGAEKIGTVEANGAPSFTLKIANSDYDHNMHVNNTKYADYALNCFSVDELKGKCIAEMKVGFLKQCHEGETLSFYRLDQGDGALITGYNALGEAVFRSEFLFQK